MISISYHKPQATYKKKLNQDSQLRRSSMTLETFIEIRVHKTGITCYNVSLVLAQTFTLGSSMSMTGGRWTHRSDTGHRRPTGAPESGHTVESAVGCRVGCRGGCRVGCREGCRKGCRERCKEGCRVE